MAFGRDEDVGIAIGSRELARCEVLRQKVAQRAPHAERAVTAADLGVHRPWLPPCPRALFGDRERASEEVESADAEAGALAPAQAQDRPQVHHWTALSGQGLDESHEVICGVHRKQCGQRLPKFERR